MSEKIVTVGDGRFKCSGKKLLADCETVQAILGSLGEKAGHPQRHGEPFRTRSLPLGRVCLECMQRVDPEIWTVDGKILMEHGVRLCLRDLRPDELLTTQPE